MSGGGELSDEQQQKILDDMGWMQPLAAITLKVADEGDKTIWVAESPATVTRMINECETRLVTFTRIKGMKPFEFSTRPDNVANVTDLA